jgi:hypothetical protein
MTYDEIKFISELASIAAAIGAWFAVKGIEKRLGCKNDYELMSLVWRKMNLPWPPKPK